MELIKKLTIVLLMCTFVFGVTPKAEAVTYVTECAGCGYDQSIAATNLAPAIALATVAIVAIIAIAVQNSHGHSSSSSSSYAHYGSSSYSSSSSSSYSY